jgi:hypothetical protein
LNTKFVILLNKAILYGMSQVYEVEQLVEQSTTSASFVDVPGTTLNFLPSATSEIWMIFVSGVCTTSSTAEESMEIRLVINDVEVDLWSHQVVHNAPNSAGYLIFDSITGVNTLQIVKVQYRAIAATCYVNQVRVVAALVPLNADFQFSRSDAVTSTTGANVSIGSLVFTPTSSGNYCIFGSVKHREYPSTTTSEAWFAGPGGSLHPDVATGAYHSCARASWNATTYFWREALTAVSQTTHIRFRSSGSGANASQHRYRKIMIFREDAWQLSYYNISPTLSTTTGASFVAKNSVTTGALAQAQNHLSLQCVRVSGNSTVLSKEKSAELRIGGVAKVRTDHKIDANGTASAGYHHTIGLVDTLNTLSAVTYENGILSPSGITVEGAESTILVLRYPYVVPVLTQTHQMMM